MTQKIIVGSLLTLLFFSPVPAKALNCSLPTVIINEISLLPQENDVPWVEIYNPESNSILLDNWTLEADNKVLIQLKGTIGSQQYSVFFWENENQNTFPTLQLFDQYHQIIDQWDLADFGQKGQSLIIKEKTIELTDLPTSGRPNIAFKSIDEPPAVCPETATLPNIENQEENETENSEKNVIETGSIRLNELFPNPEGDETQQEFIELFNEGDFDINLNQWTVADGSKSFILTGLTIKAHDYLLLNRELTKIALNNSSEQVFLTDPFGLVVSQTAYETTSEGLSLNYLKASEWYLAPPTPGANNALIQTEELVNQTEQQTTAFVAPTIHPKSAKPTVKLTATKKNTGQTKAKVITPLTITWNQWKEIKADQEVIISGTLSVLPATFAKRSAWLQSEEDKPQALEIYFHKAEWPKLILGQKLTINGKKSVTQTGSRLIISSAKAITAGQVVKITPYPISQWSDIEQSLEYTLVEVSGKIIEQNGSRLLIDLYGQELAVNLKTTAINLEQIKENSIITAVGILKKKETWEILPRDSNDIKATYKSNPLVIGDPLSKPETIETNQNNPSLWLIFLSVSISTFLLSLVLYHQLLWEQLRRAYHLIRNRLPI